MAFVYKSSKRQLKLPNNNKLGPGEYNPVPLFKPKRKVVPISVHLKKGKAFSTHASQPALINSALYEAQATSSKKPKTIRSISYNEFGSVFRSKSKRFYSQKYQNLPGPGSYSPEQLKPKNNGQILVHPLVTRIERLQKYSSIPSIPKVGSKGYRQVWNPNGKYLQAVKKEQTGDRSIGPGDYQIAGKLGQRKKGLDWTRSNSRTQQEKNTIPGPGYYEFERRQLSSHCTNTNIPFNSSTVRFKQKQINKNMKTALQLLQPESTHQETSSIEKGHSFLSKQPRFKYQKQENVKIGPGCYQLNSAFLTEKRMTVPFRSQIQRFPPKIPTSQQVSYLKLKQAQIKPKEHSFNSKAKRFIYKQIKEEPGPGSYDLPKKQPSGKYYSFESKIERKSQQIDNNPGPGYYNLSKQKKRQWKGKPFGSGVARSERKQVQIQPQPQPLQQRQRQSKSKKVKSIKKPSFMFKSNSSRVAAEGEHLSPGPGAYRVDQKWNRTSYNIQFMK